MQSKYLCAPLLLASGIWAQAAPAPPTQAPLSGSVQIVVKPRAALFSALTIARVRLGSRTERLESKSKPASNTLLGIHGAPDSVLVRVQDGFVLRDVRTGRETSLGADLSAKLPAWAASVAITPNAGQETWLYNRTTYWMSFLVDRLGFVNAISATGSVTGAGAKAPTLEAEGIEGSVSLGDGLGKVMNRFSYPDTIESYPAAEKPEPKSSKPDAATRTFELNYDVAPRAQSGSGSRATFTVRNNIVLRFYAYEVWRRPVTILTPRVTPPAPRAEPKARLWLLQK